MNYRGICLVMALITVLASTCIAADNNLKQLSEGGITVSYPAGMEAAAKKVMTIARQTIKPSIEVHRQSLALLSNLDSMSKDIAGMLGADEKQDLVKAQLLSYKNRSQTLVQCFSNIRLVKKTDAVAVNGVDAGLMHIKYAKEKDEFTLTMDSTDVNPDNLKLSYFPVLVNSDGSLRSEKKISEMALEFLGAGQSLAISPVHATVGYMIIDKLQVYHPLARWFNEGVSGWITRQIVNKYNSRLAQVTNTLFSISPKSRELQDKVNLLSWPQAAFQCKSTIDPELEAAQTQYAITVVSELLSKNGAQVLPKIMNELNYRGNPDTDTICAAVKKITGVDFKNVLLNYVPSNVRKGMASGEEKKFTAKAESLAQDKKWSEAVTTLRSALEIVPDDVNARLNLAWIEREINESQDAELQVFLSAALLKQQKYSIHLYAYATEGYYVMARLGIMRGDLQFAKELLTTVLQIDPEHKDAKRAMDEITKMEDAAKG